MMFGLRKYIVMILLISSLKNSTKAFLPISVSYNGYEGVTVAISDKIAENTVLIDKIKSWMTEASRVLYKATKYQLYFKDVTIVLPKTWSIQEDYKKISGLKFSTAHVRIDEENPVVGKVPYVFGQTECGKPGQYMHLTTYLLYAGTFAGFGEIGDVFIHEWGHLRWGLFDEYASYEEADLEGPSSFYLDDGTWKPVRCTEKVIGSNVNVYTGNPCSLTSDGVPEKDCIFLADVDSPSTASLMGHQYVKQIEYFCDTDDPSTDEMLRHNRRAPNNQNLRCNYKSAWEVMRGHSDFIGNTPGPANRDTTPSFTVEIETGQRICLSLDISGSMRTNNRNSRMYSAASNFLINNVIDGTSVGVVTFNGKGKIVQPMLTVTSRADREKLVSSLPTVSEGSTSIGSGILSCILALNSSSGVFRGSIIYLVTDGEETDAPYISDVQPLVTDLGVIVNTLALGNQADLQLGGISRASSGKSFFYSEDDKSTVLIDAFASTFADSSNSDVYIQIASLGFQVSSNQNFEYKFIIDETVGRDTLIKVLTEGINMTVTGPNQEVYTNPNSTLGVTTLKIPNVAEPGIYALVVSTRAARVVSSVLSIESKSRILGVPAITTRAWLSDNTHIYNPKSYTVIYVVVGKGMTPVLNAEVSVSIDSSNKSTTLQLHDNGIGSDIRENDGLYSCYILSSAFSSNGRHSFKVTVQNSNNAAKTLVSEEKMETFPYYKGLKTELTGNFQRVILSNELLVTNYSSNPLPDNVKPSRITTLRLKSILSTNGKMQITLNWKAVGDDLDIGLATEYDVRISESLSGIQQQPDKATKLKENIPIPKTAGAMEQLVINLDASTLTKYIVVCSVDDVGNSGEYSNIVSVATVTDVSWKKVYLSSLSLMEVIISGSVALVMLITIAIFGICIKCFFPKKQNKYKQRNLRSPYESYYDNRMFMSPYEPYYDNRIRH